MSDLKTANKLTGLDVGTAVGTVFTALDEALFITDCNWVVSEANSIVYKLFGLDSDSPVVGCGLWDILPELASDFFRPLNQALRNQTRLEVKGFYAPLDLWLCCKLACHGDSLIILFRDCSAQKDVISELAERGQKYNTVLDSVVDGVVIIDDSGIITEANQALCNMTNFSKDELIKQNIGLIMMDGVRSRHDAYVRDYLKTGDGNIIGKVREVVACKKGGDSFPAELSVNMLMRNSQPHFIAVLRDISERKMALEKLNLMARFPSENPSPVMRLDHNGKIIYANDASSFLLKQWGVDSEGHGSIQLRDKVGSLLDMHAGDINQATHGAHCTVMEQDFVDRTYQILMCAIPDAGYVNVYATDITARKRAERDLQKHRDELEDMVLRRTTELEMAMQEVAVASEAKTHFLANMSHELRTPLNAIIGYSEMLREDFASMDATEVDSDLGSVLSASSYLLELINDILDLSKIESGKFHVNTKAVEVVAMVNNIHTTVRPLMEKNQNRFILSISNDVENIIADDIRFRQVLLNVLSNAAKFTEHGDVTLEVDRVENEARFTVTDNGIGMSDEQMGRIFRPFSQGSTEVARKYGGTGLGLVISKRLCNLMGGDISISSKAGEGSVFTITIPAEQKN